MVPMKSLLGCGELQRLMMTRTKNLSASVLHVLMMKMKSLSASGLHVMMTMRMKNLSASVHVMMMTRTKSLDHVPVKRLKMRMRMMTPLRKAAVGRVRMRMKTVAVLCVTS
jgi:DNA-binding protein